MIHCTNLPEFERGSMSASILRPRDDGDYDILATFNNTESLLYDGRFYRLVLDYLDALREDLDEDLIVTERHDAVDIIEIDTSVTTGEQL
jgi:hypothetical protein